MKPPLPLACILCIAAGLLTAREEQRGAFPEVGRGIVRWLAADDAAKDPLPPLLLVLYDDEAAELASSRHVSGLDASIFLRAAGRLGAAAVVVEGLDPGADLARLAGVAARAEGLPMVCGFAAENPPAAGWTPSEIPMQETFPVLTGILRADPAAAPATGFTAVGRMEGALLRWPMLARCEGRTVASWAALAAAATGGPPWASDPEGAVWLYPPPFPPEGGAMTLSSFLLGAEQIERGSDDPALRAAVQGHVVVLASETSGTPRYAGRPGEDFLTAARQSALAWQEVRSGRGFVPAGFWHLLWPGLAGCLVLIVPRRQGWLAALEGLVLTTALCLLAALALHAGSQVLLPPVSMAAALATGLVLRLLPARRSGVSALPTAAGRSA